MESQNGKLLAALLGGAAVGAALAVLFAPAKGSEIRKKIAEETGGLKDVISKVIQDLNGFQAGVNEFTSKK
jgi:gas vesicle protein